MNSIKRLLKMAAQFGVLVMAALLSTGDDSEPVNQAALTGGGSTGGNGSNGGSGDLKEAYDKIQQALPDGVPVKYSDFQKQVGTEITDLLPGANPDTITRQGKHITIDSASETAQQMGSAELKLATRVEFDLANPSGALELTNVKGIKVSLTSGTPAFDLKQVKIARDGSGDTTISGKVQISRFLPYVPFKFTIGPDGQVK